MQIASAAAPAPNPKPAVETVTLAGIGQFLARRNWSEIARGDRVIVQTDRAGQVAATVIDPDLDATEIAIAIDGLASRVLIDPVRIIRRLGTGGAA